MWKRRFISTQRAQNIEAELLCVSGVDPISQQGPWVTTVTLFI